MPGFSLSSAASLLYGLGTQLTSLECLFSSQYQAEENHASHVPYLHHLLEKIDSLGDELLTC